MPVQDPELPEQLPVTLPVNGPLNPVEVMVPAFEMGFVFMSNPVVLCWAIMTPLFRILKIPSDTHCNPVSYAPSPIHEIVLLENTMLPS